MSDTEKQVTKQQKKYNNPNEIHPRAQSKLEELQRRGLLGNKGVKVVQPKKPEQEPEENNS